MQLPLFINFKQFKKEASFIRRTIDLCLMHLSQIEYRSDKDTNAFLQYRQKFLNSAIYDYRQTLEGHSNCVSKNVEYKFALGVLSYPLYKADTGLDLSKYGIISKKQDESVTYDQLVVDYDSFNRENFEKNLDKLALEYCEKAIEFAKTDKMMQGTIKKKDDICRKCEFAREMFEQIVNGSKDPSYFKNNEQYTAFRHCFVETEGSI